MKVDKHLFLYLLLPSALWPTVFLVFRTYFIFSMSLAALLLASLTLAAYGKSVRWWGASKRDSVLIGVVAAFALFQLFFFGSKLAALLGLSQQVAAVYSAIYGQAPRSVVAALLIPIGIFEEIYWRGGLQGMARRSNSLGRFSWLVAALYYGSVHLFTLSLVLLGAALVVGIAMSALAERYGVIASSIAHVLWIEAVVVFFVL